MAVTQVTLFRVVQIYKGNIVHDLVLHQPRPVSLGVHDGCDLVAPIPESAGQCVLFSPQGDNRYLLHLPRAEGQELLTGKLTRHDGSTASPEALRGQGDQVLLQPGDWGLFSVAGADDVQVFCQYVRIPVSGGTNISAHLLSSLADAQWTILAAVVIAVFLMLAFLHKPHGTQFESGKLSRRFSTMFKTEQKRALRSRKQDRNRKRKAVVIKEARDLIRRVSRAPRGSDRLTLSRRDVRQRRINKGGLLALNRAMRSSGTVKRLFRTQDSLFKDVEKAFANMNGGGSGGGSGDGADGPYATRGSGGGGSVGRTDGGRGPQLGGPIGDRGMLVGRASRKVRVARVNLGGGSVSGNGLSRSQIFRVVRARRGFIKWCYETALKRNPGMGGGKVTVQFKIAPTGRVVQARAAGNSLKGGAQVASCITRAVRRWRFPQSQGYSVVRFPFLFSSGLK